MFLADLHIHSTFSDGKLTIPELVDFYGKRGFGAIAITDHLCEMKTMLGVAASYLGHTLTPATFPIYQEILKSEAERAWKLYRMVLMPGYELTKNSVLNSRSAHILALGATEFMTADGDVLELCKAIQRQGALSVAAHPVSTRKVEKQTYHLWNRREELRDYMDAWEVASGPVLFHEVLDSGLPLLANSDLHHPKQIRAWKTAFRCERHPLAILEAIKKQEIDFHFYEEFAEEGAPHGYTLDWDHLGDLDYEPQFDHLGNVAHAQA